jgi:hypothetical protein
MHKNFAAKSENKITFYAWTKCCDWEWDYNLSKLFKSFNSHVYTKSIDGKIKGKG